MKRFVLAVVMAIAAFVASGGPSVAGVIGIDGFAPTDTRIDFNDLPVPLGAGNPLDVEYASRGVIFDNHGFGIAPTNSRGVLMGGNTDPTTILVGAGNGNTVAPGLDFVFSVPVTRVGLRFATAIDFDFTLTLYDADGDILDTLTVTAPLNGLGLRGDFIGLEVSENVARASVVSRSDGSFFPSGNTGNFDMDDLVFGGPVAAIPEPTALGLLVTGFAALFGARDRAPPTRRHSST
jgi:hypothetical protein